MDSVTQSMLPLEFNTLELKSSIFGNKQNDLYPNANIEVSSFAPRLLKGYVPVKMTALLFLVAAYLHVLRDFRATTTRVNPKLWIWESQLGTLSHKTAYCVNMSARFFLIQLLVFIGSFIVSWLLRKGLGRLIRGWKVGLWGMVFGLIGGVLTILGLKVLSIDFQFVDLGDNILNFVLIAIRFFGLTAVLAGIIGAIVASFGPRKKKVLPPEPPLNP